MISCRGVVISPPEAGRRPRAGGVLPFGLAWQTIRSDHATRAATTHFPIQPIDVRLCVVPADADDRIMTALNTNFAYSSSVTSYFPNANDLMETMCCCDFVRD